MPPFGSTAHTITNPASINGASPARMDQITDPLPAPVAPTTKTCVPSSCSRQIAAVLGPGNRETVAAAGPRQARTAGRSSRGGRGQGATAPAHAPGAGTVRMRQSRVPNVCAEPISNRGVVVKGLPGQHPNPHPVHRAGTADPDQQRQIFGVAAGDCQGRRWSSPWPTATDRSARTATSCDSRSAPSRSNGPGQRSRHPTRASTKQPRPPRRTGTGPSESQTAHGDRRDRERRRGSMVRTGPGPGAATAGGPASRADRPDRDPDRLV